ncbi:unnamed protein product [Cylindrotheca closterium]|uniref:Uncharacterized protein n=1 Tax=Cylindrotheca closterium TaxID=2856 RepID=A0AAD2FLT7_9STRA|nr:unnamed protein product [Cylindrotheca closterium]
MFLPHRLNALLQNGGRLLLRQPTRRGFVASKNLSQGGNQWASDASTSSDRPAWSEEWKKNNLGAKLQNGTFPSTLFFVELGFGVDQHGDRSNATKAAIRAVRNSIEFNSIPGVIEHIPGGRKEMLIHVKLGIPKGAIVDVMEVAKVFPYGRLLPIETTVGGLEFATGRVVEELGDKDDIGVCVVACISIGYDKPEDKDKTSHKTFNTKDGH